jgi:hypothetical protein
MKSIKKRLGDKVAECLEYTEVHGRSAGMDKYGIKCYVAFVKFLEGETNDPNFGIAMPSVIVLLICSTWMSVHIWYLSLKLKLLLSIKSLINGNA